MFKNLRRSRTALVGVCCALVGAAVVPVVGLATISGSTGDGPMVLQSGLTTVTYEGKSNISSVNPGRVTWSRVGDTVTMSSLFGVTPTAAGAGTAVYVPLPVDSNLNTDDLCTGAGSVSWPANVTVQVKGSNVAGHTHQCILEWIPPSAGVQYLSFTLQYRVKD